MPELWRLLEEWVGIESHTADRDGCDRMARALMTGFALRGLKGRLMAGRGAGDHFVATTPTWSRGGGTILVGHHDTVYPAGTFTGLRRGETTLCGPGVLDMKGGLAVVRTALAALSDAGALAQMPLAVVSVSDEEIGSVDGQRILTEVGRDARAGLVFEAGRVDDAIVTRRKGVGRLSVTAHGRSAHAGNDLSSGINAIWALARFIDAAQSVAGGESTVNVGLVSGGSSANTVAADASCEIDLRILRATDGDHILEAIDRIARETAESTGATFEIRGGIRRQPLERLDGAPAIFERYSKAARAEDLHGGEAALVGGGSDANTLATIGIPAIDGLGPRGRGMHTHDEFAEIATFQPRVMALVRYLLASG
jgi:glutamate carboxypeptidase